ncbi:unnamed protein product [Peniophora sp. CBMAI 1063]|nr:unnamed protein product [Peniophora sp. CBMAI 1063]
MSSVHTRLITLCGWLLLLGRLACAASPYSIPFTWSGSETSSNLSLAQREGYASRAAALLVDQMKSSLGTINGFDSARAAELVSVLALQDWLSGNATNKAAVQTSLNIYETQKPTYPDSSAVGSWNSDTLYWGLAAYYANRAYPDGDPYLGLAVNNWQLASQSVVPANGTLPRSAKVTSGCAGKSLAGGIFLVRDDLDDPTIWSFVSAMYITLSAYLYESTNDTDYLQHAEATASFFQSVFLDPAGLASYSVNVTSCDFDPTLSSWVSGASIEGIAVLANVSGNSTWSNMLSEILPAAMQSPGTPWNTADGRISEDDPAHPTHYQNVLKGLLMRGVLEARRRNPSTSDLVNLVDSYITIQLNSVLNATVNGTADTYSTSWVGVQDDSTDLTGNVGALDVLNAAFAIAGSLPAVSSNGTSGGTGGNGSSGGGNGGSSGGPKMSSHSSNVGAIVGGVVGGVAALALAALAAVLYRRRRRTKTSEATSRGHTTAVDPFPPGSAGSSGFQSRLDRKMATEGSTQLPTLSGSPPAQESSSPIASSISLVNAPRPRPLPEDPSHLLLQPNRGHQATAHTPPPAPAPPATDVSPLTPPVQLDPQAIHGLIGQLQGMLRSQDEPPPEYIPRDA